MFKDSLRSKPFGIMATALILFSALSLAACGGGGGSDGGGPSGCVSGGSGDAPATPHVICTAADLKALADRVNNPILAEREPPGRCYLLGNDIDLSAYSAGAGWTPIGNESGVPYSRFSGYFDGNGKTVSNLHVNNISSSYVGLFGVIVGGEIRNLGISNASILTSGNFVGGVAGYVIGVAGVVGSGSITNCRVTDSTVKGGGDIGGIAGTVQNGVVTNCCVTGGLVESIDDTSSAIGGIVGGIRDDTVIANCYATNTVKGYGSVGGVAGAIGGGAEMAQLFNCYATGEVSGNSRVGGVVGHFVDGYVTNCAALNQRIARLIGSSDMNFGRVAGRISGGGTLNNNVAFGALTATTDGVVSFSGGTVTNKDGANISNAIRPTSYVSPVLPPLTPLNWPFGATNSSPWIWGGYINPDYPLPVLYWQTDAQIQSLASPTHLIP